jgi:hypothetical protein
MRETACWADLPPWGRFWFGFWLALGSLVPMARALQAPTVHNHTVLHIYHGRIALMPPAAKRAGRPPAASVAFFTRIKDTTGRTLWLDLNVPFAVIVLAVF